MDQFRQAGLGGDLAPTADGFFGGFQRMLAARADELAATARQGPATTEGSRLDTHPPTAERIAAMETLPEQTVPLPDDDRLALCPDTRLRGGRSGDGRGCVRVRLPRTPRMGRARRAGLRDGRPARCEHRLPGRCPACRGADGEPGLRS